MTPKPKWSYVNKQSRWKTHIFTLSDRPRTPEVVIQPPASVPPALSKSNVVSSSSVQPPKPSPNSAQIQQPPPRPSPSGLASANPPPSQNMSSNLNSNNVMQRPSVSSMMRSAAPGTGPAAAPQPPNAAAANMAAMPNKTNCDISNTTDNAMLQNRSTMPNHQPNLAPNQQPPPPQQRLMAQQPQMQPPQMRGPSPNMRQPMQSGFPQQVSWKRKSLWCPPRPLFDS